MFPRLLEFGPFSLFGLELGPFTVYSYGVLLAAAYLLALYMAVQRAKARGIDGNRVLDLGIYLIVAALVGAKLLLLIVDFDQFRRDPAELWTLVRSGGVFYGGLVLATAVGIWYARKYTLPLWPTADACAPGIALGHVIGRMGCLLAGCCYGSPTTLPWGITFHDHFAAANVGTPLEKVLHPTQVYDAGAELLILIVLLVTEKRAKPFAGRTFWLYMLLYALSRFAVEFFRGDPRGMLGSVSTSQLIALVLAPVSIAMLVYLARHRAPAAEPKPVKTARPRR
jgi:phosphatidylglycerol:prolipoprotein diacylglycerol transferase